MKNLVEEIEDKVDFFKLNPAFNPTKVKEISDFLNERNKSWIYDGKLGDVPHTNEKYASYVYDYLGASGCTLNPYVGLESLRPFLSYRNKMNFILCRTTNEDSDTVQNLVWRKVVDFAKKEKASIVFPSNIYSNFSHLLIEVSKEIEGGYVLSPGIGFQGGSVVFNLPNVIYSASRSVINSEDPSFAVQEMKTNLTLQTPTISLLEKIENWGLIKQGDFTLSSGVRSDFYVDMRELSSKKGMFKEIVHLLSLRVKEGNSILGVESGSIGVSACVAQTLNRRFGYVRKESKNYGTEKYVEGLHLEENKKVTIIEDVTTTGSSVVSALKKARNSGLQVNQVLAIVERGDEARNALSTLEVDFQSLVKV
jgi:orotate phosphoribosyltransferase